MRTLDLGVDHLKPVGFTEVVNSDLYGSYTIRCIANLDWFPSNLTYTEYDKWVAKYHPKNLSCAYKFYTSPKQNAESRYVSLLVPLEADNENWYKENISSNFAVYLKSRNSRNKKLPIALSDKELESFISNSTKFIKEIV